MNPPKEITELPTPDFPNPADLAKALQNANEEKTGGTLPSAFVKETLTVSTNIWRVKCRLAADGDFKSHELKEQLESSDIKKISRYLESILESFGKLGIAIVDRKNQVFDYGLPEKVVAAKPKAGISKEVVEETLRPTITWNDKIYPGEVEIATPEKKNEQ